MCGKNDCDIQAWRFGVRDFYGPSDKFKVNSASATIATLHIIDALSDSSGVCRLEKGPPAAQFLANVMLPTLSRPIGKCNTDDLKG